MWWWRVTETLDHTPKQTQLNPILISLVTLHQERNISLLWCMWNLKSDIWIYLLLNWCGQHLAYSNQSKFVKTPTKTWRSKKHQVGPFKENLQGLIPAPNKTYWVVLLEQPRFVQAWADASADIAGPSVDNGDGGVESLSSELLHDELLFSFTFFSFFFFFSFLFFFFALFLVFLWRSWLFDNMPAGNGELLPSALEHWDKFLCLSVDGECRSSSLRHWGSFSPTSVDGDLLPYPLGDWDKFSWPLVDGELLPSSLRHWGKFSWSSVDEKLSSLLLNDWGRISPPSVDGELLHVKCLDVDWWRDDLRPNCLCSRSNEPRLDLDLDLDLVLDLDFDLCWYLWWDCLGSGSAERSLDLDLDLVLVLNLDLDLDLDFDLWWDDLWLDLTCRDSCGRWEWDLKNKICHT